MYYGATSHSERWVICVNFSSVGSIVGQDEIEVEGVNIASSYTKYQE